MQTDLAERGVTDGTVVAFATGNDYAFVLAA